jgi:hypothetical protein
MPGTFESCGPELLNDLVGVCFALVARLQLREHDAGVADRDVSAGTGARQQVRDVGVLADDRRDLELLLAHRREADALCGLGRAEDEPWSSVGRKPFGIFTKSQPVSARTIARRRAPREGGG